MKSATRITVFGQGPTVNSETRTHSIAPRVAPIIGTRSAIATVRGEGAQLVGQVVPVGDLANRFRVVRQPLEVPAQVVDELAAWSTIGGTTDQRNAADSITSTAKTIPTAVERGIPRRINQRTSGRDLRQGT